MTDEPTNADRAAWAKEALAVFTTRTFRGDHPDRMNPDDLKSAVGDLIADLLHFAGRQGFGPEGILRTACGHFGYELAEETRLALSGAGTVITAQLVEALDYLLQQTVDMDLKHGIALTEGEAEARARALAVIARAAEDFNISNPTD